MNRYSVLDIIQSCKILDFYKLCYLEKKTEKMEKQERVLTNYSQVNQIDKFISVVKNKRAFWEYLGNVNKGY